MVNLLTAALSLLSLSTLSLTAPLETLSPRKPHPIFTLSEITYHSNMIYSTPAHLAVYGGDISFNLTNSAVQPKTVSHCTARGMHLQDMFYGEIVYQCGDNTNFTYARPLNTFVINQTWTDDRKTYLGQATGSVELECETTNWQNTNWTMGQFYYTTDTTCQPGELKLEVEVSKVKQ